MCDIRKEERKCKACKIVFMVCLTVSVCLIVAGFFTPPKGIIDGSVLTAVGEIFAFAALGFGWHALELGYDLKINHGQTTIEVDNDQTK